MGRGQAQVADRFSAIFGDRRGTNRSEEDPTLGASASSRLVIGDYIFILFQPDDPINASSTKASVHMYRRGEADIELADRVPIEKGEYGWWHAANTGGKKPLDEGYSIGGREFSAQEIEMLRAWLLSHEAEHKDW